MRTTNTTQHVLTPAKLLSSAGSVTFVSTCRRGTRFATKQGKHDVKHFVINMDQSVIMSRSMFSETAASCLLVGLWNTQRHH